MTRVTTVGRYPKAVRAASIKCIDCNAPVVETIEQAYVCAECGESPIRARVGTDGGEASE
ncbi:hypothetical protein EAF64_17405 [Halorientalis pallida]|uniref:Uncharacterized protein n=1 Tax=Halorientalis pallida TaxID=2479928 RepID=A0A498KRF7_9EURY|nr:hypothetical protein EAF64_17405 [Halorientalis pallida]